MSEMIFGFCAILLSHTITDDELDMQKVSIIHEHGSSTPFH